MGSCAAPSVKGDDKFITTDYLQQCQSSAIKILGLKKPGIFYICIPLKRANDQVIAAFFEPTRGRENGIRENVAQGLALINNREAARAETGKPLPRKGPYRRKGL
ncbi:TPA: hypothetical protein ACN6ZQ_002265 [Escherichia albertii]|uniref:hypothetical protein n=1 Tax=Escherichia albertii TaxID=208962 RepID=UPI00046CFD20|nr:hypothetical protein [Escherichia albertii]